MKRERELREIMEQAIAEMREVLSRETGGTERSSGTRTPGRKRWFGLPVCWANGWCKLGVRRRVSQPKLRPLLRLLRGQTPPAPVAVLMVVERLWPD